jgi:hypothetical protein
MRRFDSQNKETRSVSRAGKLWRSFGVGMSEAIDLTVAEVEPPTGGVPSYAGARKQSCYVQWGRTAGFQITIFGKYLIINRVVQKPQFLNSNRFKTILFPNNLSRRRTQLFL